MKNTLVLIACFISVISHGQDVKTEFDGHKWEAPYNLAIPKDWNIERFLIPISFAPQITYVGVEDIRFTPGWAKITSEEYWTYAFLWYLDGKVAMSSQIITRNLTAYYTGLYKANTEGTSTEKAVPAKVSISKAPTDIGDLETYTGTIDMMDYLQRKPILLNCIIHVRSCNKDNKTILFYELSPKSFSHSNWINLNRLWASFDCEKGSR